MFTHTHARPATLYAAVATFLVCAAGSTVHAQNFFDDFSSGNDSAYQRFQPLAPFGAGGTFTFSNGGYRIQGPASPAPLQLGVQRLALVPSGVEVADFRMSVDIIDWNTSTYTAIGLFARTREVGLGTTDGYYAHINIGGDSGVQLAVDRVDNEVASPLLLSSVLNVSQGDDYRLVFTGVGTQFSASFFSLGDLATPLATLTGSDGAYSNGGVAFGTTGIVGVTTGLPINNPLDATFDNFRVVPAPGAVALMGLGSFLVARRRRR